MLQAIKDEPTDNIILSGEKGENLSWKIRKNTRMPTHIFIQQSIGSSHVGMKQEKKIKANQIKLEQKK